MNDKRKILLGLSITTFVVLSALVIRKKIRDKKARTFYLELEKLTNGTSEYELITNDALNPNYYKQVKNANLLTDTKANEVAEKLYKSFGIWGFGDDENQIYSIFQSLSNKAQISQVSEKYYEKYNITLDVQINEQLDENEVTTVLTIINNKPNK